MKKLFTLIIFALVCNLFVSPKAIAGGGFELFNYDIKESLSIYPNPIVNNATIKISNEIDIQENKVSIIFYNIIGKEIFKISQAKGYEIGISKDNFKNSGVYFYQLKIDDKLQNTGRIIVK